jgi:lipopolysaccharide/colanic/teichoic acid biosynthesis glycosyltransferase
MHYSSKVKIIITFFDIALAISSPYAAWIARGIFVGQHNIPYDFNFYAIISAISTLVCIRFSGASSFSWRFYSVTDAIVSASGILVGIIIAVIGAFIFDRLGSVPRSLLLIHIFIQIFSFVGIRYICKRYFESSNSVHRRPSYALLVGCNQVSYIYIRAVESISRGSLKIIAALTHDPSMIGHRIRGISIISIFNNIDDVLGQYKIRGIDISRIVVTANENEISPRTLEYILDAARRHNVNVSDIHFLFSEVAGTIGLDDDFGVDEIQLRGYFWGVKRVIDIIAAFFLLLFLLPVFIVTTILVWLDVGSPMFFWQQRPGRHGKMIRVYKFRTMKDSVRSDGVPLPDHLRTSKMGLLLRKLRLDELPQLWNIIIGDMSFIGPRPLLFADQPEEMSQRLAVRPGISGWAQVNGGKLVSPEQKRALDLWYISHASLFLEIKIAILTLVVMIKGDVERPNNISTAVQWLQEQEHSISIDNY